MAQEYASQQPAGFTNQVKNVAIVGAGGTVGKFVTEELLKAGKFNVAAITRPDSQSALPAGVIVKKVDYNDQSSLASALEGIDVLIITMGVTAPPDTQSKLIQAAAAASVPFVMPNEWGTDHQNESLGNDTFLGPRLRATREEIEKAGKSSWIGFGCGFWYEFSLGGGEVRYGFDFKNRSLTIFDDGETKINTSTWPQCGRAVAKLLSLPILPKDENDKSPYLAGFKNKPVYISSFLVSQKDMFASVQRVTSTTEKDWTIKHENSTQRYKEGVELFQKGQNMQEKMAGFGKLLYTRVFYPNGGGDYESVVGTHNELLGLPKEDFDEATKKGIEIAEKGFAY